MNQQLEGASWACEKACSGPVATVPSSDLCELKSESPREVVCATQDLLEDASFCVEQRIRGEAEHAFRQKLSVAFIPGDGPGLDGHFER